RNEAFAVSIGMLIFTAYLFTVIPKGFIPSDDQGQIVGYTEGAQGVSFQDMAMHQQELVDLIRKDPDVTGVSSTVGQSDVSNASNTGSILVLLKPSSKRRNSVEDIIERLRPKLATVSGIQVYLQNPPTISIGGQVTKSLYQFTLQGPDSNELYQNASNLMAKMHDLPQLQDITSDMQISNPQLNIDIERDKASALGLTAQQIEQSLDNSYGTKQISTIFTPTNEYQVIVELEPEYQKDPDSLS